MTRHDETVLRQYVLGTATPEQAAAIEDEYFERGESLERVAAVEDDLIDDYLSNALSAPERAAFEGHYLSTPVHRTRVAVARSLRTAAAQHASRSGEGRSRTWSDLFSLFTGWSPVGQAVLVAATVILAVALAWVLRSRQPAPGIIATREPQPVSPAVGAPPPAATRPEAPQPAQQPPAKIVVFTLSAIAVRSAGGAPPLKIPSGTDLVALRLEGDAQDRSMSGRALVRTVEG
jgi:hypothetical protein